MNPSIPLGALLVTAGFVAAGFVAQASALDQGIGGLVDVQAEAHLDVVEATGEGDGEAVQRLHLTVETGTRATANLSDLEIRDEHDRSLTVVDVHPTRDEDGSLEHGLLGGEDVARLVVELAEPMQGNEVQGLVLVLAEGGDTELVVETPPAIEDGYTRLEHAGG